MAVWTSISPDMLGFCCNLLQILCCISCTYPMKMCVYGSSAPDGHNIKLETF